MGYGLWHSLIGFESLGFNFEVNRPLWYELNYSKILILCKISKGRHTAASPSFLMFFCSVREFFLDKNLPFYHWRLSLKLRLAFANLFMEGIIQNWRRKIVMDHLSSMVCTLFYIVGLSEFSWYSETQISKWQYRNTQFL